MLEIADLAKHYGPIRALDGATFSAARGDVVALVGASGAGKASSTGAGYVNGAAETGTGSRDRASDNAPTTRSRRFMS